jgi:Ca-activated chloride channel family protein
LTLDYEAAKMYLDILDPGSIPVPGTALAEAIGLATKAFERDEYKHKVLILLTDGEDHEGRAIEAAREAEKSGVVVDVIGIGSPTGEPIPLRDANGTLIGYKKDKSGRIVTSRLDDEGLRKIALAGGGRYYSASSEQDELRRILEEIGHMEKKTHSSVRLERYQDRFAWFLVPGILLLLVESLWPERSWTEWSLIRRRRDDD